MTEKARREVTTVRITGIDNDDNDSARAEKLAALYAEGWVLLNASPTVNRHSGGTDLILILDRALPVPIVHHVNRFNQADCGKDRVASGDEEGHRFTFVWADVTCERCNNRARSYYVED